MSLRLASIAFLLGTAITGLTWLSVQPLLFQLVEAARVTDPHALELVARVRALLPMYLGLDLVASALLVYAVLFFSVGRPLRQTEAVVKQISRLEPGEPLARISGPLWSRLGSALRRMSDALTEEKALTQRQLRELREANERLANAQLELIAAERLASVGRLAAGVAHEVGNPLSGILGYLSVLRSRAEQKPELVDLLGRVELEVQRIDRIVRGLLDLGRPVQGKPVPVDVRKIGDEVMQLARAGPDFSGVQLAWVGDTNVWVLGEPGPLAQVLWNLLLNAAQAMGPGDVEVGTRRDAQWALLWVRDHGPGLSATAQERLFEPFFTTKEAGKGTGLGLAVCAHLVRGMGGEITAANAPGGGAEVTVRLRAAG